MQLSFTPTREAALQRECDAFNAANPRSPVALQAFLQTLMDARADHLLGQEALAVEATPQRVLELKETIRQKDEEIARLIARDPAAEAAALDLAEPAP